MERSRWILATGTVLLSLFRMQSVSRKRLLATGILGVATIAIAFAVASRNSDRSERRADSSSGSNAKIPIVNLPGENSAYHGPAHLRPETLSPFSMDGFSLPVVPQNPPKRTSSDVIQKLRDKLKQNPGDLKSRIQLAASLDSVGEASEAEDVLRAALQRNQKTPEVFHALGTVYLRNAVYSGAADAFLIETKLKPKSFDAHFRLGTAYAYLQKTEEARREFEIAQKLDPTVTEVYIGLAFLNNGQDRFPYAVKYLNEYIKRSPQPGTGYGLLSRVYLNMRSFDKAMEAGKIAVKHMPDNPYIWYNLGQAYLYQPKNTHVKEAVDALQRAVGFSPNWSNANFELGRAFARLGKNADAISAYREAVRTEPSNGRFQYQLGQLLVKSGQVEEGNKILATASRLIRLNHQERNLLDQVTARPRDTKRLFELSRVYTQLGDNARASSILQTIMKIDPQDPRARAELRELRANASASGP